MEIFYNNRPSYNEIVSYGPKWLTEYREMDANYRFAGWTLDLMAHWLERIVNNQFPACADEQTVRILERLFRLEYNAEESVEERRKIVTVYYSGTGKLSKSVIQSLVMAYSGCESEVTFDGQALQIDILGEDGPRLLNDKLLDNIAKRMPAHLGYTVSVEEKTSQSIFMGIAHTLVPNLVLTCEKLNYTRHREYMGIGYVMSPNIILT